MVAITSLIFSCGVHNLKLSYVGLGTINFISYLPFAIICVCCGEGDYGDRTEGCPYPCPLL